VAFRPSGGVREERPRTEFKLFQTGLELFQAMIGGSLDVLSTGAVISNFPARGQGKMFLANAVEFATAQLWVREDKASRRSPIGSGAGGGAVGALLERAPQ
jgi:hypothetical protein